MGDQAPVQRLLVRSCQRPGDIHTPFRSTTLMGGNQGNLLYQFATQRALCSDAAIVSTLTYAQFEKHAVEARAEKINSEADHLVLPLSNSFRLSMDKALEHWSDLIERLTIPVTVVGVGAQVRIADARRGSYVPSRVAGAVASGKHLERHTRAVQRFVTAVLDRSSSIGVRGELTRKYLIHLGFPAERIDVIGCPSLFLWGPNFRLAEPPARPLSRRSPVSLSFDHRIDSAAPFLDRAIGAYRNATVYAQDKLVAQMVITGREHSPDWSGDARFPMQRSHRLYQDHRLVYNPTAWGWMEHLRKNRFASGPRLHGTIAALLAGTPSLLWVHDSRTLEIAEYHGLPHVLTEDLDAHDSLQDLFRRVSVTRFNELYPQRFADFSAFLNRNNLITAYQDGGRALAEFDRCIRAAAKAPDVISRGPRNPIRRAAIRAGAAVRTRARRLRAQPSAVSGASRGGGSTDLPGL